MDNEVKRQIGGRIRQFRESLGLNQKKFGALFGKTHQTVSKWEAGKAMPSLEDWFQMGRMSGSLDYLVYGIRTRPIAVSAMVDQIFARPGLELQPAASGTLASQQTS